MLEILNTSFLTLGWDGSLWHIGASNTAAILIMTCVLCGLIPVLHILFEILCSLLYSILYTVFCALHIRMEDKVPYKKILRHLFWVWPTRGFQECMYQGVPDAVKGDTWIWYPWFYLTKRTSAEEGQTHDA